MINTITQLGPRRKADGAQCAGQGQADRQATQTRNKQREGTKTMANSSTRGNKPAQILCTHLGLHNFYAYQMRWGGRALTSVYTIGCPRLFHSKAEYMQMCVWGEQPAHTHDWLFPEYIYMPYTRPPPPLSQADYYSKLSMLYERKTYANLRIHTAYGFVGTHTRTNKQRISDAQKPTFGFDICARAGVCCTVAGH
jgi:hypothetical protein